LIRRGTFEGGQKGRPTLRGAGGIPNNVVLRARERGGPEFRGKAEKKKKKKKKKKKRREEEVVWGTGKVEVVPPGAPRCGGGRRREPEIRVREVGKRVCRPLENAGEKGNWAWRTIGGMGDLLGRGKKATTKSKGKTNQSRKGKTATGGGYDPRRTGIGLEGRKK